MEKKSKNIKFVLHETKDTHTSKFDQTAECDGKKNDVKNFMAEKSQLNWSGNTATK